jgi:hypothetical protein
VWPVVRETYGASDWSAAASEDVTNLIVCGRFDSRGREYAIMLKLWDWFPGGDTAEAAAAKIEAALPDA